MTDKLYSRRRIKVPNIFNGFKGVKAFLVIAFFTIIVGGAMFLKSFFPVLKATCETTAGSKGNRIINEKVKENIGKYSYDDLIKVEMNDSGDVTLIKSNTILINQIVTEIVSNIQKEFDNMPRINVFVNMGTVTRN